MTHRHHIIPKHEWKQRFCNLKGFNAIDNIVFLSIEQHANVHKWLWEQYERWQDRLAWLGLSKQIGKDEIILEIIRGAHIGRKNTQESKSKMSKAAKGRVLSDETKLKISVAKMGSHHSNKTKSKMRERMIGNNYGLGYKHSEKVREKMSLDRMGNQYSLGHSPSIETRKKISNANILSWKQRKLEKAA